MRSNYKRLGDYIRQVDVRNRDLVTTNLIGISINKYFMPSVANVIGTDLTKYKLISKNQFACNPMHVGRDGRLPVALFSTEELAIVSPAYFMFEIIDPNLLLSEYLMMWFMRPEFDRYCTFKTDSSVRGGIEWGEICDVTLPVPDIKVQQQIVDEYNVVKKRIDLNERLIKTLEETAQAVYKQWFVDFDFPDENGKPYKSNGGKMIDSELGEIPDGWSVLPYTSLAKICGGGTPKTEVDCFWNGNIRFFTPKDTTEHFYAILTEKTLTKEGLDSCSSKLYKEGTIFVTARGTVGKVSVAGVDMAMNQSCYAFLPPKKSIQKYLHLLTLSVIKQLKSKASGAVFDALVTKDFEKEQVLKPNDELLQIFEERVSLLYFNILNTQKQILVSENLKGLLLSKLSTVEG